MANHQKHAVDWAKMPTPAQQKEFWSQIESGKITKSLMQQLLKGELTSIWPIFEVEVDYRMGIQEMIQLCEFDYVDGDIVDKVPLCRPIEETKEVALLSCRLLQKTLFDKDYGNHKKQRI